MGTVSGLNAMLTNVLPVTPARDILYGSAMNAELSSKSSLTKLGMTRNVVFADETNLFIVQFGLCIFLAAINWVAAFCKHITHVVKLSAEKQMRRVTAQPVIALMENTKPIRDWTVSVFPGKAVRLVVLLVKVIAPASIFLIGNTALPFPTIIGAALVNFGPKKRLASFVHDYTLKQYRWPVLPEVSPVRDRPTVRKDYNGLFFKQQSLTGDKFILAYLGQKFNRSYSWAQ